QQNPRSPDQQFNTIAQELCRLGYPWVHLGDYRDDHISGRWVRRRAGLQRLLSDIRSDTVPIDLILVDTFDRFGRAAQLNSIRRELAEERGVLILTADSHFDDPTSPAGQIMAVFEGLRAVEDNRIKAHQVRRGKRDVVARKLWPGGPAPLGYRLRSVTTE